MNADRCLNPEPAPSDPAGFNADVEDLIEFLRLHQRRALAKQFSFFGSFYRHAYLLTKLALKPGDEAYLEEVVFEANVRLARTGKGFILRSWPPKPGEVTKLWKVHKIGG
jgi:hypothetical protein